MAGNNTIILNAGNFDTEVLKANVPVLVDFWAEWCGPCRMIAPIIDQLAEEYHGKIKVCKLNIDEQGELALRYGVMSIPTLIVFSNGNEVEKTVGANTKEFFEALIHRHI